MDEDGSILGVISFFGFVIAALGLVVLLNWNRIKTDHPYLIVTKTELSTESKDNYTGKYKVVVHFGGLDYLDIFTDSSYKVGDTLYLRK